MRECEICNLCFPDEISICTQDGVRTTATLPGEPTLDGRYELLRRIGSGSMGIVFEARHIFLRSSHAIKVILPDLVGNDPMLYTRFRQRALVAAAIRHPNIIAVTDFGVIDDTMPFLVMEFVNGQSLRDILVEEGLMTLPRAFAFIRAIGVALGAAHRQNIWHHNLKPSNIMVRSAVSIEGLRILDFGLTEFQSSQLLRTVARPQTTGSLDSCFYMAPERWANLEPDARADIYSLGIILYQMLTGEVPFKDSWVSDIRNLHLKGRPASFESLGVEVPPEVEAVVHHALEKEASARPSSVEAFLTELREAVDAVTPNLEAARRPERPLASGSQSSLPEARAREAEARRRKAVEEITQHEAQGRMPLAVSIPPSQVPEPEASQVHIVSPELRDNETLPTPQATPNAETPIYLDDNVQFTVYRPKKIRPQKWYTLLAYAHLSERRPGEDEPDPIERMEAEAQRILGEQKLASYSRATEDSSQSVPRRGEITFIPFIAGVEFNPASRSFFWQESVHGQEFRLQASAALDGKTVRGQMTVFLGSILLAEINLSVRVDSALSPDAEQVPLEKEKPVRPYRRVFPSYSHKDSEIVAQIEHYAQISGDEYMRDINKLRSGQDWKQWMRKAIEDADIFQLFWSTNSMRSENVKLEWQYALLLRRQNFIRPTYWESPLPQSLSDNLPPPELLELHFQQVRSPVRMATEPARKTYGPGRVGGFEGLGGVVGGVLGNPGNQTSHLIAPKTGNRGNQYPAIILPSTRPPSPPLTSPVSVQRPSQNVGPKRCPACNRQYADESLDYCLEDDNKLFDTRLSPVVGRPLPTVDALPADLRVRPSMPEEAILPPLKRPLWLVFFFAILVLVVGLLVIFLIVRN